MGSPSLWLQWTSSFLATSPDDYHHLGGRTHGGGRHVVVARMDYIVSVSLQHLFAEPSDIVNIQLLEYPIPELCPPLFSSVTKFWNNVTPCYLAAKNL